MGIVVDPVATSLVRLSSRAPEILPAGGRARKSGLRGAATQTMPGPQPEFVDETVLLIAMPANAVEYLRSGPGRRCAKRGGWVA
jgi:hypothetical protein